MRPLLLLLASCAARPTVAPGPRTSADALLRAPLAVPRPNFFHAALLVPPMQPATVLLPGEWAGTLSSNHTDAKSTRTFASVTSSFHGSFHEWIAGDLHYGLTPAVELSARTAIGGWDEVLDHFLLRDSAGNLIVTDEESLQQGRASQRHENLTHLDLGARLQVLETATTATAIAAGWKIPVARRGDLTNAGTNDLAATLLETVRFGNVTLHANVGAVWPIGQQTLFHANQGIGLAPFAQGAIGLNLAWRSDLAFDLQVQGNTSAFRDVPFLREGPISIVGGARRWFDTSYVELGFGHGLDRESADVWELLVGLGRLF